MEILVWDSEFFKELQVPVTSRFSSPRDDIMITYDKGEEARDTANEPSSVYAHMPSDVRLVDDVCADGATSGG